MAKLVEAQNMKNPSLGKLRSLCQINQVHKEENQRRNLTCNNFAQPCKTFASLRNSQKECNLKNRERTVLKEFRSPLWNFARPFTLWNWWKWVSQGLRKIRNLAKPKPEKMNFATLRNSPCVIFKYFLTDSIRFLSQDILCNYPFSPCNQLKIFFTYCNQLNILFC